MEKITELRAKKGQSHPSRGAWIEISRWGHPRLLQLVAPLAGCVD